MLTEQDIEKMNKFELADYYDIIAMEEFAIGHEERAKELWLVAGELRREIVYSINGKRYE